MDMRARPTLLSGLTAALALAAPLAIAAPVEAAAPGTVTTVISHLDNPRGLVVGRDGQLYVVEAGHGGSDCPSGAKGPGGRPACFGSSGAFTRIVGGRATRLASGFASVAGPGGIAAEGASAAAQSPAGPWNLLMGGSSHDTLPGLTPSDSAKSSSQLGRLLTLHPDGTSSVAADVGDADYSWSAAHQSYAPKDFPDANPFAVLADGPRYDVADAASNTLDFVTGSTVRQRAFIPHPPVGDAVPTCVAKGPDGALYVGELTAAGNKPGSAVVWRIWPNHNAALWRSGFTNISGCGFDPAGNFYAAELQTTAFNPGPKGDARGAVIKVSRTGARTTLGYGKLFYPQGFAFYRGAVYVSNWSIMPATSGGSGQPTGQIARVEP